MAFLEGLQQQLSSVMSGISSQGGSFYTATQNKVSDIWKGTLDYTAAAAAYLFGKDRTPANKSRVLSNFVAPVAILVAGTAFLWSLKAAVTVAAITGVFTLLVAKQRAVI